MVTAVAYTNFRKDLKSYLRRVNDDADIASDYQTRIQGDNGGGDERR